MTQNAGMERFFTQPAGVIKFIANRAIRQRKLHTANHKLNLINSFNI